MKTNMNRKRVLFLIIIFLLSALVTAQEKPKVALVLDKELETDTELIKWGTKYVQKVEELFNVEIIYYSYYANNWTPEMIRDGLKSLYKNYGIQGAMLVGFWPLYKWETQSGYALPVTLPYEDLDDDVQFLDAEHEYPKREGYYDLYTWRSEQQKDRELEIWVSMIRPLQAEKNNHEYTPEVKRQLSDWFKKCYNYYCGNMTFRKRGNLFCNIGYANLDEEYSPEYQILRDIYEKENVDYYGWAGIGDEYLHRLINGYEVNVYFGHGSEGGLTLNRGPRIHLHGNSEFVPNMGKNALVNNIYSCSNFAFYEDPAFEHGNGAECIGLSYALQGNGMAAIGVPRPAGTGGIPVFLEALENGDFVGEAYKKQKNWIYQEGEFPQGVILKHELIDLIFIGNPFIYIGPHTQSVIQPNPAELSGRVQWEDGTPVSKAEVMAFFPNAAQPKKDTIIAYTTTDADGNYHFDCLAPGTYKIVAVSQEGVERKTGITVFKGQIVEACNISLSRVKNLVSNTKEWYLLRSYSSQFSTDWKSPIIPYDLPWAKVQLPITNAAREDSQETPAYYLINWDGPVFRMSLPVGARTLNLTATKDGSTRTIPVTFTVYPQGTPSVQNVIDPSNYILLNTIDTDGNNQEYFRYNFAELMPDYYDFKWERGPDYVLIRRNFSLAQNHMDDVFLNVSADNGIQVYVNNTEVPLVSELMKTHVRPTVRYYNYSGDISKYCHPGDNFVVIITQNSEAENNSGRYLDATLYQVEQAGAPEYTITGKISVKDSGIPLVYAPIRFAGPQTGTALTDVNGNYSITAPAGEYTLIAYAQDYWFRSGKHDTICVSLTENTVADFTALDPEISYLSEMAWSYESSRYGTRKNEAVNGQKIKVKSIAYDYGLCTYPKASVIEEERIADIRYDLNGQYFRFVSYIGLDDNTERKGNVIFEVYCDNKLAFVSPLLYDHMSPELRNGQCQFVDVDVQGVDELKLIVKNRGGDIDDWAAWADAKLLTSDNVVPEWKIGIPYEVGDQVLYKGTVYTCTMAHTSQADWYPGAPGVYLWELVTP